jgi:hypothetical protein
MRKMGRRALLRLIGRGAQGQQLASEEKKYQFWQKYKFFLFTRGLLINSTKRSTLGDVAGGGEKFWVKLGSNLVDDERPLKLPVESSDRRHECSIRSKRK